MKVKELQLTHNFCGMSFIDLDCITHAMEQKLFNSKSYTYLLESCAKKGYKVNLVPLEIIQKILNKHPKKKSCWCLSGKNYIDCHFNKHNIKILNKNELFEILKKNSSYQECLHKNISSCSNSIIKAHSISKKNSLESISTNKHVYGMKLDFSGMTFSKLGINNASTFTGFCKKHDEFLFSSFEKNDFEKSFKQLFDLCYRAICIEYNSMQSVINLLQLKKEFIDNSEDISKQISKQISINSKIVFYKLGIKYSDYYKKKMEELYKIKTYENLLEHYIFELADGYPKFQSSTCFNLNFDLDGNQIQDLDNAKTLSKNLYVNCLTMNGKGYFILSWFNENHEYGHDIIKSIINNPEKIEDKLFSLNFLYIHNTFVSPEWYESLTENEKTNLNILQNFWNDRDQFSNDMIQSNMNSIKVKNHYYFIPSIT